ncbi:MAG: TetR/AcrR family transcriptional regulator [Polyangiaceae bacterium]
MSRPVNADADKTRNRILESATVLFAERGVGSTSVRDVASKANVSLAMVSHYFGGKGGLYDACVEAMFAELSSMREILAIELELDSEKSAPLEELFALAVHVMFRFACDHRTAVRLLIRDAVSTGEVSPTGRKMLLETMKMITDALALRLGRPAIELRLPLQSIVFLIARYAAQAEGELCVVAGFSAREKEKARAAVEAHLVEVALGLLGMNVTRRVTTRKRGA